MKFVAKNPNKVILFLIAVSMILIVLVWVGNTAWLPWHQQNSTEFSGIQRSKISSADANPPSSSPVANAYTSTSYQKTALRAERADATLDDVIALQYASNICQTSADIERSLYFQETFNTLSDQRSFAFIRRFAKSFCGGNFYSKSTKSVSDEEALDHFSKSGDFDAKVLLRALRSIDSTDELGQSNIVEIRSQLLQTAETTTSPYVYFHANQLLVDPKLLSEDIKSQTDESTLQHRTIVQGYGALMATCMRFQVCSPSSLFTIRYCVPHQCADNQNMRDYLSRRMNKDEFEEALAYAHGLNSSSIK